jgi:hypothetical protein
MRLSEQQYSVTFRTPIRSMFFRTSPWRNATGSLKKPLAVNLSFGRMPMRWAGCGYASDFRSLHARPTPPQRLRRIGTPRGRLTTEHFSNHGDVVSCLPGAMANNGSSGLQSVALGHSHGHGMPGPRLSIAGLLPALSFAIRFLARRRTVRRLRDLFQVAWNLRLALAEGIWI